jgi:hypothetical protein
MGSSRLTKNNFLNYAWGSRSFSTPSQPADVYFGLSTTAMTDISNLSADVTVMSYTGKVVTLTATNTYAVGDSVVVAGVNTGLTVTNIDGTWVCQTGTNATTIVFTVTSQPVGTTPQTFSVGVNAGVPTVKGGLVTEPGGGSYARTAAYSNDGSPLQWTVSSGGSLSNTEAVSFTKSTASWGTIQAIFVADSGTTAAGNVLWFANLSPALAVPSNTTVTFDANTIMFGM